MSVIAKKIDGILVDLNTSGPYDEEVLLDSSEGLGILRHSMAHIMAAALQKIDANIKFAIGPAIENGFYYDILSERVFSTDDLSHIQGIMHELINQKLVFTKKIVTKQEAINIFTEKKQLFKLEILKDIDSDTVSLYQVGEFVDLCRGPHIPSTSYIPKNCFKLIKVSGAYWRGDSKNQMLQRIYGVTFANQDQLKQYIYALETAQLRDHRKLGKELDLFHIDEVAPGNIFWLPNGLILFDLVKKYIQSVMEKYNYQLVKTPQLLNKSLWETSGHWGKFKENMFIVKDDNTDMAIKPMNCPGHIICYKTGAVKSYKDLPIRIGEFGICHRNESSGSLHGIMRLRSFMQDDGHIFCTPEQIVSETITFCSMLKEIYSKFGFSEIEVKFSDRPNKRVGTDDIWNLAEQSLKEAADNAGLKYTINKGEGAFYGPKLEFVLKDCLNRAWQCGTLQVDFNLPERFDIYYTDSNGKKHHPVMLHRAILGSIERFIGILIENHAGKFPFWLAPKQVSIVTISQECENYAVQVKNILEENNFRTILDTSADTLTYKIRKYSIKKVPITIVIGKKEMESQLVGIRALGTNKTEELKIQDLVPYLSNLLLK